MAEGESGRNAATVVRQRSLKRYIAPGFDDIQIEVIDDSNRGSTMSSAEPTPAGFDRATWNSSWDGQRSSHGDVLARQLARSGRERLKNTWGTVVDMPGPSELDKRRIELLLLLERFESALGFIALTILGIILSGFASTMGRSLLWLSITIFTSEAFFQLLRLWFLESYFKDVPCRQVLAHQALRISGESTGTPPHVRPWWMVALLCGRMLIQTGQSHNVMAYAFVGRWIITCMQQAFVIALAFLVARMHSSLVKSASTESLHQDGADQSSEAGAERMYELFVVSLLASHLQYLVSHFVTALGLLLLTLKPPSAGRSRRFQSRRFGSRKRWHWLVWRRAQAPVERRTSEDSTLELLASNSYPSINSEGSLPSRESLEGGIGGEESSCTHCWRGLDVHFCWAALSANTWLVLSAPVLVLSQLFSPQQLSEVEMDETILPRIAWYVHLKKHPHLAAEVARYREDECGLLGHWFFTREALARKIRMPPNQERPIHSWETNLEAVEFLARNPENHAMFAGHMGALVAVLEHNDQPAEFAKTHEWAALALGHFWENSEACREKIVEAFGIEALIALAAYSPAKGAKEAALRGLVLMASLDDSGTCNPAFVRAVHTSGGVAVFLSCASEGSTPACQEMGATLLASYALWADSADELLRPDVLSKLETLLCSPLAICRRRVCNIVRLVASSHTPPEKLAAALLSSPAKDHEPDPSPRVITALVGALVEGLRLPAISTRSRSHQRGGSHSEPLIDGLVQDVVEALGSLARNTACWTPVWDALRQNQQAGLTALLKLLLPDATARSKEVATHALWNLLSTSDIAAQAERVEILYRTSVTQRQYVLVTGRDSPWQYDISQHHTHTCVQLLIKTAYYTQHGQGQADTWERSTALLAKMVCSIATVLPNSAADDILCQLWSNYMREPISEIRNRFLRSFAVVLRDAQSQILEHRHEWIGYLRRPFENGIGFVGSSENSSISGYALVLLLLGCPGSEKEEHLRQMKTADWHALFDAMLGSLSRPLDGGSVRSLSDEELWNALLNIAVSLQDMEVVVSMDQGLRKLIRADGLDRVKYDEAKRLRLAISEKRPDWPKVYPKEEPPVFSRHRSNSTILEDVENSVPLGREEELAEGWTQKKYVQNRKENKTQFKKLKQVRKQHIKDTRAGTRNNVL